jgi:hypothetical protein
MAHFDVAFADDGNAVAYGSVSARRLFRFTDGTIASAPANGPLCSGLVGQGNIPRLMTRDFRLMIYFRKAGLGAGRIESPRNWCGTAFVVLSPPTGTPRADMVFAALSPDDDRLATVYETARRRDFIEIRDVPAQPDAALVPRVLASLPVDGKVNYRIGWSADGRLLAAVADTAHGFQARIYRIR